MSRFRKLFLPRYTEQEFTVKVLHSHLYKNVCDSMARYVGVTVFKNGGDIRDVISIGKLIRKNDGPDDIEKLLSTMSRYGGEKY